MSATWPKLACLALFLAAIVYAVATSSERSLDEAPLPDEGAQAVADSGSAVLQAVGRGEASKASSRPVLPAPEVEPEQPKPETPDPRKRSGSQALAPRVVNVEGSIRGTVRKMDYSNLHSIDSESTRSKPDPPLVDGLVCLYPIEEREVFSLCRALEAQGRDESMFWRNPAGFRTLSVPWSFPFAPKTTPLSVRSDTVGAFAFEGLEPGWWYLTLGEPAPGPKLSWAHRGTVLEVPPGRDYGASLTYYPVPDPERRVFGRVLDDVGDPVRGFELTLIQEKRPFSLSAKSDAEGEFYFYNVEPGGGRLRSFETADGDRLWLPQTVFVETGDDVVVRLTRRTSVGGVMVARKQSGDAQATEQDKVSVRALDVGTSPSATPVKVFGPRFEVLVSEPGTYTLFGHAAGGLAGFLENVRVDAGRDVNDLSLIVGPGVAVELQAKAAGFLAIARPGEEPFVQRLRKSSPWSLALPPGDYVAMLQRFRLEDPSDLRSAVTRTVAEQAFSVREGEPVSLTL